MKPSGLFACVVSCLVCTGFVSAATWYVDVNGSDANDGGSADAPFATIQWAIDRAGNGDSIEVWPGTHRGTGESVAHIEDKSLTLYARDGMKVTFIDGEHVRRGLLCEPLVVVDEVGIRIGGYDEVGGRDQGFTIQNCLGVEFYEELPGGSCYARECGGGLFVHTDQGQTDALVKVEWSLFQNNTAAWGGGAAFYDSTAALTNCIFRSNTAAGSCDGFGGGVGIGQESNVELHFCDFVDNRATYGGGGSQRDSVDHPFYCSAFNSGEEMCLAECDLVDQWNGDEQCQCDEGQPACYFRHYGGAYFNGCTFVNNTAESAGGGLCCSDINEVPYARTYLSGCVFTGNEAGEQGGCLMGPVGHLVMTDCHFDSNQANICLGQSTSGVGGGGVMLWGTNYARMTDCSFVNNGTYASGGAIYSAGTLRLMRTRFDGNWAQASSDGDAQGGALFAMPDSEGNSWLALDQCDFIDNVAGRVGGAITTQGPGDEDEFFLVSDCRFVGNRASYDSCQSCLECMDCEDDGVDPYCGSMDGYDCVASCTRGGLDGAGCDHATDAEGGAIYHGGFAMTLERCCFLGNDATSELSAIEDERVGFTDGNARGGAIARPVNPRQLEIRNCVFAENSVSAWCDQFDTAPDCMPANYDPGTGYGCGEALGGAIRDFPSNLQSNLVIAGTLFCQNTEPDISADNGYTDGGGNEFDEECPVLSCDGDFTCDGRVDVEDILAVLNGWDNPYDVNAVLNVIGNWGCTVDGSSVCACADGA